MIAFRYFAVVSTLLLVSVQVVFAQGTKYSCRDKDGNGQCRYYEGLLEGTRGFENDGLKLISALATTSHQENIPVPQTYKIRFYLTQSDSVKDVLIRERKLYYNYRLDKVKQDWKTEHLNDFEWSANNVLIPTGLEVSKLGVVVSLPEKETVGNTVVVAPAIFYSVTPPNQIDKYEFIFEAGKPSSSLGYKVRDTQNNSEIISENWNSISTGENVSATVESSGLQPGHTYDLVLKGKFSDGLSIHKTIRFNHHKLVN